MSDVKELKKENKKLKRLLKDAVVLLNKYKDVIQSVQPGTTESDEAKTDKNKRKKRSAKRDAPAAKKK